MRERIQEWAPYLGALGIALWAAAAMLYFLGRSTPQVLLGLVGLGVILIALYVINRPAEVKTSVTGRSALYGSNVLLMSIVFIGVIALGNVIIQRVYHGRYDVTAGKTHTLSQLSVNVAKNLKQPVLVTMFIRASNPSRVEWENAIKDYQFQTDKITYREIDPDANPQLVQEYDIAQDATAVFEVGSGPNSRKEKVYTSDENTLTNALLKVTQTQQKVIYFTTGHGEMGLTDTNQTGLSNISNYLTQINYKVAPLNLATVTNTVTISGTSPISGSLPVDTSAVVIANPQKPFSTADAGRIKDYLDHGGRVLVMLGVGNDSGLKDLFQAWGVDVKNDLVIDPAVYVSQPAIPAIQSFPSHAITQNLEQYAPVFFPGGTRSVTSVAQPPAGRTPLNLFATSPQSCGKDYQALKDSGAQQIPPCDPNKDEKGPLNLGVVVEASTNPADQNVKSRLAVFGNANFVANGNLTSQVSQDDVLLFENTINWLAGEEQLISVPPRQDTTASVGALTGDQENLILWSNLLMLPVAVLLIGGVIWWRRR